MNKRITHIDIFRGMLMMLVVLGHSIGTADNPVNRCILSFHMPAFFFLSGICYRGSGSIAICCKKKFRGLVYPYLTLSIIGVIAYWTLMAGTARDQGVTFLQSIIGIIWNDGEIGRIVTVGFWFVFDLICITFIHIVSKHISDRIRLSITTIAFAVLYHAHWKFYFEEELVRISVGYLFFLLGNLFQSQSIDVKLKMLFMRGGKNAVVSFIVGVCIVFMLSQCNTPILMFKNQYGNLLLFIISSLLGSVSFYLLSCRINKNNLIEYIGKNSLLILQLHPILLAVSHVAMHKFFPTVSNYTFPTYLVHFSIVLVLCISICSVVNRWFKWLVKYPIG